ncbi:hypothetical protein Esti_000105 [Eimeria stiedai]
MRVIVWAMGGALSAWFPRFFGGREVRVLILGLDNAGKTTLLYRLHLNEVIQTIPTIGFNVETVKYKNIEFQGLGLECCSRPYWRCYYPNTQALIYVVDSSDVDRISDARQELLLMIEEEELKDVALAVVANKQDLPKALNEGERPKTTFGSGEIFNEQQRQLQQQQQQQVVVTSAPRLCLCAFLSPSRCRPIRLFEIHLQSAGGLLLVVTIPLNAVFRHLQKTRCLRLSRLSSPQQPSPLASVSVSVSSCLSFRLLFSAPITLSLCLSCSFLLRSLSLWVCLSSRTGLGRSFLPRRLGGMD